VPLSTRSRNLVIGNADSKNSLNDFWEEYMLLKGVYTVTSRAPDRPIFDQIATVRKGDLIMLNRNRGHLGGIVAITTVLTEATPPSQYDYDHSTKQSQWISEAKVEPWLVLPQPFLHGEMWARLGHQVFVSATVNPVPAPDDAALVDLFFEKLALKFK
jgi:hypothetical protein